MRVDEFEDLLGRCLEDQATPEEQERVVAAAQASPDLERLVRLALDIDVALRVVGKDDAEFYARFNARVTRKGASQRFSSTMMQRLARRQQVSTRRWRLALPLAALIALAVGAGIYGWLRPAGGPAAQVVSVAGEASLTVAGETSPLRAGMRVAPGGSLRTGADGAVVLEYADGSRLRLRRDTAVTLAPSGGAKLLTLDAGSLRGQVAKQPLGAPMRLATANAEAVVVGTRFGLSHRRGLSRLSVAEGLVRGRRLADGAEVDVPAGNSVVVGGEQPFALRPNRVTRELLALYVFDEGAGDIVHDVAHAGPPADLVIGEPRRARWTDVGLSDPVGGGGIAFHGRLDRLIERFRANHGLTIEEWFTRRGLAGNGSLVSAKVSSSTFTTTSIFTYFAIDQGAPEDVHGYLILKEHDNRLTMITYRHNQPVVTKEIGESEANTAAIVADPDISIVLAPALRGPDSTLECEYRLMAIYGCALTQEEIDINEAAGLPQDEPDGGG